MKARHQVNGGRPNGIETVPPYHADSPPNSSAILVLTVLADLDDVLAVIRTAAVFGNNFNASTEIDLLGKSAIRVESGGNTSRESLENVLDSIESKLSKYAVPKLPVFAVETSITAASFLTRGAISVHVRKAADSAPKGPMIAR